MLLQELNKRKQQLESHISKCRLFLRNAPEGYLRPSLQGKRICFYRKRDKSDKQGVYTNEKTLIARLAKKEYAERVLEAAKEELKALERLIKIEKEQPVVRAFTGMHPAKQELIRPLEITMKERIRQFMEVEFTPHGFKPGSHAVVVDGNHLVRSAAEYRIETALKEAGIPYRYEPDYLTEDGMRLRPDFMMMNPRTGQVFYWEHFGMIEKQDYRDRMLNNLSSYELSGLFPGNGLIATFDDGTHPLSRETIRRIIDALLS